MDILVIDVGGTNVKMLATGQTAPRHFPSGRRLTPDLLVERVLKETEDWHYDAVSIGYPGLVDRTGIKADPVNLGKGWVDFHFSKALGRPVKVVNDAAMQALGSYDGGRMLFVGLGTGVGSALISGKAIVALELGELIYEGETLSKHLGRQGRKRLGAKKWRHCVHEVLPALKAAFVADYVVVGGGNAKKAHPLPEGTRLGGNENSFRGGFRLWVTGVGPTQRPHSAKMQRGPRALEWFQV